MEHSIQSLVESIHRDGSCPRLQVDLTRPGIVCPDFVCEKWGEKLIIDLDPSYPLDLRFTATGIDVDLSFGGYVSRCTFPYAAIYMVADRATGKGMLFEENMPESAGRQRPALRIERGEDNEAETSPETSKKESAKRRGRSAGESRRRRRRPKGAEDRTSTEAQVTADESQGSKEPKRLGLVALRPVEENPVEEKPAEENPVEEKPAVLRSLGVAKIETAGKEHSSKSESEPEEKEEKEEKAKPSPEVRRSVFRVIEGGKSDTNSQEPD